MSETSLICPGSQSHLSSNLKGYDISPEMTKLAMANIYLHTQDKNPNIDNYDTLTSTEHWNEYADVMLANPPFMTPRGGITPHGLFRVPAKRAEVLFVDYIASHLNEYGRAGIIVPEGIIFQSQNAYKQLRRLLVDESLIAVISLPGGVFNPYSGVKTSILILDKVLAPKTDSIAFFKVDNDGYDLGAQRRPISQDDLPIVTEEINEFLRRLRAGDTVNAYQSSVGHSVGKSEIQVGGDYNLSGERHRATETIVSKYTMIPFRGVCTLEYGASLPKRDRVVGPYPVVGSNGIADYHSQFLVEGPAIIVGRKGSAGEVSFVEDNCFPIDTTYFVKLVDPESTDIRYLYRLLNTLDLPSLREGAGVPGLNRNDVYQKYHLPLPPLEVQRELVAEIEGYQRVIDGARAVVDNWRPRIAVDPEWPTVPLQKACDIQRGKFSHRPRNEPRFYGGKYPFIQTGDVARADGAKLQYTQTLNDEGLAVSKLFEPPLVVVTIAANIGETAVLDFPCCFPDSVIGLIPNGQTDAWFLELVMRSKKDYLTRIAPQAAQKNINIEILKTVEIPLPPLATQQAIVDEIEAERALVSANHELIERVEQRVQATIARVWEI